MQLKSLQLMNADAFHIRDLCIKEISILNSTNGRYSRTLNKTSGKKQDTCQTKMSMNAHDTTFHFFAAQHVESLTMKNCSVGVLTIDSVDHADLEDTKMGLASFSATNVTIKSVHMPVLGLVVKNSAEIHNSFLDIIRVSKFEFNPVGEYFLDYFN